ncbi:MAG: hypothetical protein PHR43_02940 [Dehalococcoidales bacterium]|nr:hypothetical protein [Dehalococcoidales bacterium]
MAEQTSELEALKQELETRDRELTSRGATIVRLEKALADKDCELAGLRQTLADTECKLTVTGDSLAQAVGEYRNLVIGSQPEIPAELITGGTIAEVNESLCKAQALVARVRQGMEAETAKTRVPAGAPPRTPLDVSALSAREKIQYAIGGS